MDCVYEGSVVVGWGEEHGDVVCMRRFSGGKS